MVGKLSFKTDKRKTLRIEKIGISSTDLDTPQLEILAMDYCNFGHWQTISAGTPFNGLGSYYNFDGGTTERTDTITFDFTQILQKYIQTDQINKDQGFKIYIKMQSTENYLNQLIDFKLYDMITGVTYNSDQSQYPLSIPYTSETVFCTYVNPTFESTVTDAVSISHSSAIQNFTRENSSFVVKGVNGGTISCTAVMSEDKKTINIYPDFSKLKKNEFYILDASFTDQTNIKQNQKISFYTYNNTISLQAQIINSVLNVDWGTISNANQYEIKINGDKSVTASPNYSMDNMTPSRLYHIDVNTQSSSMGQYGGASLNLYYGTYGDVNRDGCIDEADAELIRQYALDKEQLDEEQLVLADVNGDGHVKINDAVQIVDYYTGQITVFPVGMTTVFYNNRNVKLLPYGDVNRDGVIDLQDTELIVDHLSDNVVFDNEQLILADVNGDGKILLNDHSTIMEYYQGRREELPLGTYAAFYMD